MDANNVVAAFAFGIGFIQMYQDYTRSEEMDEKSKNAVLLSLLASCLWLIYQSRKYGMNFTVAYTGVGLLLQLYLLNKILVKEDKKNKSKKDDFLFVQ
jgi:Na+/proline symporter